MYRIALLHGVNLGHLIGSDPALGPVKSLRVLEDQAMAWGWELGVGVVPFQTDDESEFIRQVQRCRTSSDGMIINAGAWGHYSWALVDALRIADIPTVEVHLSDTSRRDMWRRTSVVAGECLTTISGEGATGYRRAIEVLMGSTVERPDKPN